MVQEGDGWEGGGSRGGGGGARGGGVVGQRVKFALTSVVAERFELLLEHLRPGGSELRHLPSPLRFPALLFLRRPFGRGVRLSTQAEPANLNRELSGSWIHPFWILITTASHSR